jgi:hypothetical protein
MRSSRRDRSGGYLAALLALPLLGLLHGCVMVVDADDYLDCPRGTLLCKCGDGDYCDEGLQCFDPGLCVVPPSRQ